MVGLDGPLQGLTRAQESFDKAASDIARPQSGDQQTPQDQVSLSDSMVALMQARNDYEANLKSLETSNNMAKKLIDMLG
jgi:flagellar hook-associated protein FlgK